MKKIRFSVVARPISHGMLAIYINCEQFGKSVNIDTSVHVFNDEWDSDSGRIVSNPNSKKLNILIRKTLYELEEYELDYDGEFTLCKLSQIWDGRETAHDFYRLMNHQIHNRDIRTSTKGIHERVLSHLKKYRETCSVSELTEEYVKGFISYMRRANLNQTTICMHVRVLRCYYNIARKMFGNKVPAGTFEFWHEKKADKLHLHIKSLEDEDIRILENRIVQSSVSEKDRIVLERFLFMSYTGTRISDFCFFSINNFSNENGKLWLTYTSVKTDTDVRIPLSAIFDGRAEQIVTKYMDHLSDFFGIDKTKFNSRLKIAARNAGLTKRITAHVARHTCASRLVSKGVPITTIQRVVGHRSLRMTMEYANTSESALVRQLS